MERFKVVNTFKHVTINRVFVGIVIFRKTLRCLGWCKRKRISRLSHSYVRINNENSFDKRTPLNKLSMLWNIPSIMKLVKQVKSLLFDSISCERTQCVIFPLICYRRKVSCYIYESHGSVAFCTSKMYFIYHFVTT